MKNTILKLTAITILAAAITNFSGVSRAADTDAAAPAKKAKVSGEKFYGPITAIDKTAMTFTVGDQTFVVSAKTKMTSAKDDSKATLETAVVGEPARGTYTKDADGKLNVDKVRFGKKSGGAAGGKSGGKKKKDASAADTNAPAATPQK